MQKILLVFEDYGELMALDSSLKRVGFDVLGISSEYSMADQILSFNPDLVIGSGSAGKVTSLGVGKRLKDMSRWTGKVVLLFPANFKPAPQDLLKIRVDMILESPVPPLRMVQVLAKLLGHDEAVLLERLNKASHAENTRSPQAGKGSSSTTEAEAPIYVQGGHSAGENSGGESHKSSFGNKNTDDDISLSDEYETKKNSFEFRLGERVTQAVPEKEKSASTQDEFSIDLKALERELLGEAAPEPEVERVEDSAEALEAELARMADELESKGGSADEDASAENFEGINGAFQDALQLPTDQQIRAQQEQAAASGFAPLSPLESLKKAQEGLAQKVGRYTALVADVKVAPKSTVSRVEARRRQRRLREDWEESELLSQDELRREFTKGLFKK